MADSFEDFAARFVALFTSAQFRGNDFPAYCARPAGKRGGDEASVVDVGITLPILQMLGFAPGECVYNQGKKFGRPDFAPAVPDFGTCFVVEDKSTGLELMTDAQDPDSHLAQLSGYVRALGLRAGWLTNGRRLMVWRFDDPIHPVCALDLDVLSFVQSPDTARLFPLWEGFRRETFADWKRLEAELALEEDAWQAQALSVGSHAQNQELLVGSVRTLLRDLQADARARLDSHLQAAQDCEARAGRLSDDVPETVAATLAAQRASVLAALHALAPLVGLTPEASADVDADLRELERSPRAFLSTRDLAVRVLAALNAARTQMTPPGKKPPKDWQTLEVAPGSLAPALDTYARTAFAAHQREAVLRHDARESLAVSENYALWKSLVQETMLGGLDEGQTRDEFALQAAYVVFIRLLLLRVCEDKGIFPHRFVSDGGLKRWQEDIERYFVFASGNPYATLLNMAYENAQNIYAHFFTGRELFNWYALDRRRFVRVLYQLSRFNFADVDSDLIGTIYNTYVERKEKKQKGQYYTPPPVVRYILDETGYRAGPSIIGSNKKLIDPACGSGTFLVEAARRLTQTYLQTNAGQPREILNRVRDSLYGFDLNPFACYLAEVNLLIQVLDLVKPAMADGEPPRLQRFHVYNVDALAPPSGVLYYARANTLMAEEMDVVDRIKGRAGEYASGFAFVVANPPYGAGLTDAYKQALRSWWPDVFYGKPDTYVFFYALALRLLGASGRLGFITPNTFLMGTNTDALRNALLSSGRLTQIVDLPQGLWPDANVDCALLFLTRDAALESRRASQTKVFSMDVRDELDKLEARAFKETLSQPQAKWMDDPRHEINIRWTPLLQQIEEACRVPVNGTSATVIQRLGDVTDSSQGIIPYKTREDGVANRYIKPTREVPTGETDWKPLLDGSSYVERYGMRAGKENPRLKYGNWLWCPREPRHFDEPKFIVIRFRNRALKRRLVAAYDESGLYARENFSVINTGSPDYDLKYLMALFNSSLLNYWYARRNDQVTVNPAYFRQLPIAPADAETQAEIVGKVDELLAQHDALNQWRAQDYVIRTKRDGTREISVPPDVLLGELQKSDAAFPVLSLFDARAAGHLALPPEADPAAQIGRVFESGKQPDTLILRANQLWLTVQSDNLRAYLAAALARPQWKGRAWDEISTSALLPEPGPGLDAYRVAEAARVAEITARLDAIAATDAALDARILDLYGITAPADRDRILGEAPPDEDTDALPSDEDAAEVATEPPPAPDC